MKLKVRKSSDIVYYYSFLLLLNIRIILLYYINMLKLIFIRVILIYMKDIVV